MSWIFVASIDDERPPAYQCDVCRDFLGVATFVPTLDLQARVEHDEMHRATGRVGPT